MVGRRNCYQVQNPLVAPKSLHVVASYYAPHAEANQVERVVWSDEAIDVGR